MGQTKGTSDRRWLGSLENCCFNIHDLGSVFFWGGGNGVENRGKITWLFILRLVLTERVLKKTDLVDLNLKLHSLFRFHIYTINMAFFTWRHVPALGMATGKAFGGLMPLFNPENGIRTFGLPESIATSREAQVAFTLFGSCETMIGAAMWIFYLRGQLEAVDTLMAVLFYGGAVDAYALWRQGEVGKAWFRGLLGVFVGGWGLLGLTAGGGP
jgi:hypothetical protein